MVRSRKPKPLAGITPENAKSEFVKAFKAACDLGQSPHRLWSDWLEAASLTMHQLPFHDGEIEWNEAAQAVEERYFEVVKRYRPQQLKLFGRMLGAVTMAMQTPERDLLGELHIELELAKTGAGQFFMPYDLSRAVAAVEFKDLDELIAQRGVPIVVEEPAVGAGSMVIAVAQTIAEAGHDYRAILQVEATDVDRDCFNMSYIQFCILGIQAVVRQGDSLSKKMTEARPTPQLRYFWKWQEESGITKALMTMRLCQQALDLAAAKVEQMKNPADDSIDNFSDGDSSNADGSSSNPTAVQQLSLF